MSLPTEAELEQTLRERFALERFRPGQREVIGEVLQGRDVLCVMPTGGGKSLCYQFPSVVRAGVTLVVSPLIALMKDQVDALTNRGIRATLINSTIDPDEQRIRIQQIEAGEFDLVYVAPERFRSSRFVEVMQRVRPALLAIDEAHCISEWGHDFRPDYAKIGKARRALGMPPCIALTATATDLVRRDIADQLGLNDPALFVTGFDRPNLSYGVIQAQRDREKIAMLGELLDRTPGSAIVYASSRSRCEAVATALVREMRQSAVVYHAGLSREDREAAQNSFMSGDVRIVVATNAFGMGVDKADIRSVIHFNHPGTVEAYYQEAGRAGRDGLPARCVILYSSSDHILQEMFIENEYPSRDLVHRVYDFLRSREEDPIELTHAQIKEEIGGEGSDSSVGTCLKILESAGGIERFQPWENMAIVRIDAEAENGSLSDRISPQATTQRMVLRAMEGLVNRRWGESVYFHPDSIAAQLGMERSALTRALKVLKDELPIDYVPPFRGNAARVLDRGRAAKDLKIDFKALEARKKREYEKLDRMIKYAQTRECRRLYILNYFGDKAASKCGRCDNCGSGAMSIASTPDLLIDTEAGKQSVLKVLSGVARAKGRVGKNLIAQMLVGSNSEKVSRAGLRSLSTFGILSDLKQADVVQILDALQGRGMVEAREVESFRPVVDLTESGRAYLKSPTPIRLEMPDELVERLNRGIGEGVKPVDPNGEDASEFDGDPLHEKLKRLRLKWARESGKPAYTVFTNETLNELVRVKPKTPAELLAVKGFGSARMERFGRAVLEAISGDVREEVEEPAAEEPSPAPTPVPEPAPPRPAPTPKAAKPVPPPPAPPAPSVAVAVKTTTHVSTEEWTYRLLEKGFSIDDAAAIRCLDRGVVIRHLAWMVRRGSSLPLTTALPSEIMREWSRWKAERDHGTPPPDADDWPGLWPLFAASTTD